MTQSADPFFPDPPAAPPEPPPPTSEMKSWMVTAHLLPLAYFLVWWIPGSAVALAAPLLVLRFKRGLDPLVADQAREAFNFHVFVAGVSFGLCVTVVTSLLVPVLWIAAIVFAIFACVHSSEGQAYRYPLIWRLMPHPGELEAPSQPQPGAAFIA